MKEEGAAEEKVSGREAALRIQGIVVSRSSKHRGLYHTPTRRCTFLQFVLTVGPQGFSFLPWEYQEKPHSVEHMSF